MQSVRFSGDQAEKLDPHPHELVAFGFWKTNPRPMISSLKSIMVPFRYSRLLGSQMIFTIKVKDANSVCAELAAHGVSLINGPVDRPWGRRTAAFADPDGNVWEIAQDI